MTHQVHQARGPLYQRQLDANKAGAIAYVEQHCNATTDPRVNYAMAIVAPSSSEKSKAFARSYTRLCAKEFGIRDAGLVVGGRGAYNLKFTSMPAFLAEPGFISNPEFAGLVRTGEGIDALARCLVGAIREHFPAGLIALSVGHKYRDKPDPGAAVYQLPGTEDPAWNDEAEICDAVVIAATEMLRA
jgi:N-acetylmuramoyl-L-alanine amidase